MELIDKYAVVAEIERCEKICEDYMTLHKDAVSQGIANAKRAVCQHLIKFLDTLEVKKVVTEQEGICNGIFNTIIGDTWHIKIPLYKERLKHGDKVKIFITKEK